MPSKTWAQHKLMTAVEHSPSFAEKVGIPQRVGADFAQADDKAGITKRPDKGKARQRDEKLAASQRHHEALETNPHRG